jgi:hypothetical protein
LTPPASAAPSPAPLPRPDSPQILPLLDSRCALRHNGPRPAAPVKAEAFSIQSAARDVFPLASAGRRALTGPAC